VIRIVFTTGLLVHREGGIVGGSVSIVGRSGKIFGIRMTRRQVSGINGHLLRGKGEK
jgi:hypothetical protein